MRGAGIDGVVRDYWNVGEFQEIVPMDRLVMTMSFADEHGNLLPASYYGMPGERPHQVTLTVLFGEVSGGTRVTVREAGVPPDMHEPARMGWEQSLDKIEQVLGHGTGPMRQKITPALMFTGKHAGKSEEAIHFYTSLFKGSRILAIERYGPGEGDTVGTVKFSSFTLCDQTFNARDSSLPHAFTFTPAVSFFVSCETEEEVDRLHRKLSEGEVLIPLDKYPFADKYSWVNDRYGVSWQLFFKR